LIPDSILGIDSDRMQIDIIGKTGKWEVSPYLAGIISPWLHL